MSTQARILLFHSNMVSTFESVSHQVRCFRDRKVQQLKELSVTDYLSLFWQAWKIVFQFQLIFVQYVYNLYILFKADKAIKTDGTIYDFTVKDLDGNDVSMEKYR